MSEAILSENRIIGENQTSKDMTPAKMIYFGLMVLGLLSYLWNLAIGAGINTIPIVIWIIRLLSVPFALFLGKLWKDKGFQILSLYFLWFFLRIAISNPSGFFREEASENILSALWLFSACYGLGKIIKGNQLKSFLQVVVNLWILGIVICSILGIVAIWRGQRIEGLTENVFYGYPYQEWWTARLEIGYVATVSGALLSISALISTICGIITKKKIKKCIYIIATIIILQALALTDSRTAFISFSIGFALVISILIFTRIHVQKTWHRWVASFLGLLFSFALSIILLTKITPLFNHLMLRGMFPSALAEETVSKKVANINRGFDVSSNAFSGRFEIWKAVLSFLKQNPKYLLIGKSKIEPLSAIAPDNAHCHNIFIQVLLESGIVGLLLLLFFVGNICINCIRVIKGKEAEKWIVLLPALIISLIVGDMVECFTWLRSSQCPMGAILLISAGIICAQVPVRKKKGQNN